MVEEMRIRGVRYPKEIQGEKIGGVQAIIVQSRQFSNPEKSWILVMIKFPGIVEFQGILGIFYIIVEKLTSLTLKYT